MVDRKKCKMMYVWGGGNKEKHKRIVIDLLKNGGCIAVDNGHEENFKAGKEYNTMVWDNCGPIPEKKYRPMTNAEMRGFIANSLGVEYRHKSWEEDYWEPRLTTSKIGPEDWQWRTISPTGEVGEPQEFVVEVEE